MPKDMIKMYTDFINEASVNTEIQTLETDISKLKDAIQEAKNAIKNATTDAAKKAAKINAYNLEANNLTQISQKLKEIARLMASPEVTV